MGKGMRSLRQYSTSRIRAELRHRDLREAPTWRLRREYARRLLAEASSREIIDELVGRGQIDRQSSPEVYRDAAVLDSTPTFSSMDRKDIPTVLPQPASLPTTDALLLPLATESSPNGVPSSRTRGKPSAPRGLPEDPVAYVRNLLARGLIPWDPGYLVGVEGLTNTETVPRREVVFPEGDADGRRIRRARHLEYLDCLERYDTGPSVPFQPGMPDRHHAEFLDFIAVQERPTKDSVSKAGYGLELSLFAGGDVKTALIDAGIAPPVSTDGCFEPDAIPGARYAARKLFLRYLLAQAELGRTYTPEDLIARGFGPVLTYFFHGDAQQAYRMMATYARDIGEHEMRMSPAFSDVLSGRLDPLQRTD